MKRIIIIIIFILSTIVSAQDVELRLVNAKDKFKWGVKFFNRGLYEKSVFSFERSLSFDSTDNLTHMWLARAYYMKGDIEAALKEWSILSEIGASPLWLDKSIDIISANIGVESQLYKQEEWVPLYNKDFSRPSSVLTIDSGSSIVVSFMTGFLEEINANGAIVNKFNGGLKPFDRPFDIIKHDKKGYIVSEFMGNKISFVDAFGLKTASFNAKPSLAGPQYLIKDNNGYFYVSDWGNRRVCKFDMDGNYILSIKNKLLKGPTGVLIKDDNLFVADQLNKKLFLFDSSGNLIETVLSNGLESPEGLTLRDDSNILIADGIDLKNLNIKTRELTSISDLQGKAGRITKGSIDTNGNILAVDFNMGSYYALTDISSIYGGLYIIIDRISTDSFPSIQVECQVYNRIGNPIVGLDNTNFLISEENKIVEKRDVILKGDERKDLSVGYILDMCTETQPYLDGMYDATKGLQEELGPKDSITLVKGGIIPTVATSKSSEILDIVSKITPSDFVPRSGIDMSIKLAASFLISQKTRRELILVTTGEEKSNDFEKYSLDEIKDFLQVNHISFSVLYLTTKKNPELEYLTKERKGFSRYLYSDVGVYGLLDQLRKKPSGFYILKYKSLKNINNGEAYTTMELEVDYIRKSGRSEAGFFVPVKVVSK